VDDGAMLTLDHVKPGSHGGSNKASNLITACKRCNSARHDRPVTEFAAVVAAYRNDGTSDLDIVATVRRLRRRKLDRNEAKRIIARRGYASVVGC